MPRKAMLILALSAALPLGGCAAGLAASAVGMAVRGARGTPENNARLAPDAVTACSAHAARYGSVHIIDVEQSSASKIIVWGAVDDGKERRSFQCDFGTKITGFRLRSIGGGAA